MLQSAEYARHVFASTPGVEAAEVAHRQLAGPYGADVVRAPPTGLDNKEPPGHC
ncbi:hypothetical protein [Streptomyces sp. NPDC059371]|uniref:hypothetical protein n=1 Tax=Streptomyces sp. NPDC059371 TaxID=3346812 RepID=UPI0036B627A4